MSKSKAKRSEAPATPAQAAHSFVDRLRAASARSDAPVHFATVTVPTPTRRGQTPKRVMVASKVLPEQRAFLIALGGGNISAGIDRAIAAAAADLARRSA